jgi:aspartate kinase
MAHLGAKVLHPRAAEIAMDYDIPLWVRATESGARGTLIAHEVADEKVPEVTGVTNTGPCAHVSVAVINASDRTHVALEVFRLLATAGISVYFVSGTPTTVSFVVDKTLVRELRSVLNAVVIPVRRAGSSLTRFYLLSAEERTATFSAQKQILDGAGPEFKTVVVPVTIGEDTRAVSLIGRGLQDSVGVMWRMADCLLRAGVRFHQTADSKLSLSCLVDEQSLTTAVRALHAEFIETTWEHEEATEA